MLLLQFIHTNGAEVAAESVACPLVPFSRLWVHDLSGHLNWQQHASSKHKAWSFTILLPYQKATILYFLNKELLQKILGSTVARGAFALSTCKSIVLETFSSISSSVDFPRKDVPSRCSKNLPVASRLHCFKAGQPEGLLPVCRVNYRASSWCSCKFYSVVSESFSSAAVVVSL